MSLPKGLIAAGAIVLAVGWLSGADHAPASLLIGAFLLLTLGVGGLFFLALEQVTGAFWSASIRRVPEAMGKLHHVDERLTYFVGHTHHHWRLEGGRG